MPYLAIERDRHIHYEDFAGTRIPIVLVHGWAASSRCWDRVVPALRDAGHRVITFDHRCCGHSDADFVDVGIRAIAADVGTLLDRLDVRQAVLNGWSLGGAVVVAAAARLGTRVAGLVLTGAATPRYTRADDFPHGGTEADVRAVLDAIDSDRVTTFRNVARAVFAAPQDDEQLDALAQMFLDSSPRAAATLLDLAALDQRDVLRSIGAPTLIAHGSSDEFVPLDTARAAAAALPDARLSVYQNCGHAPFLEARARYYDELRAFLASLEATS